MELKFSKAKEEGPQNQLASKVMDFNSLFGGSHKLSNILLQQKSLQCKLGLRGHNYHEEFKKPLNFIKAKTLGKDVSNVANTSKKKEPMITPNNKIPPQASIKKMSIQASRKKEIVT